MGLFKTAENSSKINNLKQRIYLISGLGADESIFAKLDLSDFDSVHIPWIHPLKNESIESYAIRLSNAIPEENPWVMGLSFGGMVGVEILKQRKGGTLILISSAKTKYELPQLYRYAGKMKLDRILPAKWLKCSGFWVYWLFGVESPEEKIMLKKILKGTDELFLKWAIGSILNWKNQTLPNRCFHIHGTKDRILSIRNINDCHPIEGGGHSMVYSRAEVISEWLKEILKKK